jgi:hypothetical protein
LKDERLKDNRFDKIKTEEEESSGILAGMDQINLIIDSGASIQSSCGLRAYTNQIEKLLGGPSRETTTQTGQQIIKHLISPK